MAFSAEGRISRSTPSMPSNLLYCFTKAFFGSVKICINASSVSSAKVAMTGIRPINSGMMPNFIKSSGSTSLNTSVMLRWALLLTNAPKPMPDASVRFSMTFSKPENAPPQINKILVVSICKKSWFGCLRPPCGGMLAIVPSISFNRACCTPSPDTSRVIDGLSDLREILSISSI